MGSWEWEGDSDEGGMDFGSGKETVMKGEWTMGVVRKK
jgi:hypothetical protein